jgi:hypothetical protein
VSQLRKQAYQQKAVLLFSINCLVQASDGLVPEKKQLKNAVSFFGKCPPPVFCRQRLNFQISGGSSNPVQHSIGSCERVQNSL